MKKKACISSAQEGENPGSSLTSKEERKSLPGLLWAKASHQSRAETVVSTGQEGHLLQQLSSEQRMSYTSWLVREVPRVVEIWPDSTWTPRRDASWDCTLRHLMLAHGRSRSCMLLGLRECRQEQMKCLTFPLAQIPQFMSRISPKTTLPHHSSIRNVHLCPMCSHGDSRLPEVLLWD